MVSGCTVVTRQTVVSGCTGSHMVDCGEWLYSSHGRLWQVWVYRLYDRLVSGCTGGHMVDCGEWLYWWSHSKLW